MKINKIALQYFRNQNSYYEFGKTTVFVGANGIGKTSIAEAVNLLSIGGSFRAKKIEEMVGIGEELARVKGKIELDDESDDRKNEELELEAILTRGKVQGKRTQYRLFSVNGVRRRKKDFVGKFLSVVFRPEDLRLIEGSPSRRRNFINDALSQVDGQYRISLSTYDQALKRRNRLLQKVREKEQPRSVLTYWNLTLVKHGEILQKKRQEITSFLQRVEFPFSLDLHYEQSIISTERQAEYLDKEIIVGHTLIGPHKDDFIVKFPQSYFEKIETDSLDQKERSLSLAHYGSRGQQRLGVLWLKIGELEFLNKKTGQLPVLLLDDIFSELDEKSRGMVLALLGKHQVIITTADKDLVIELEKTVDDLLIKQL